MARGYQRNALVSEQCSGDAAHREFRKVFIATLWADDWKSDHWLFVDSDSSIHRKHGPCAPNLRFCGLFFGG
jgi:hypothetical protein